MAGGGDDVQVDAVMAWGGRGRWCCRNWGGLLAEMHFALVDKFLALVLESKKLFDAGENILENDRAGLRAGEFKGFFVKKSADDLLDALGLVMLRLILEIGDGIHHGFE